MERFVENDIYIAHLKIDLLEYKTEMLATGRWVAGFNVSQNALRTNSWNRNRKNI